MDLLDRFSVLLLDMNGTFMFGQDRFGPEHDYAATYRRLGGRLPGARVREVITACYDYLSARYPDPAYYGRFPSVREAFGALPEAAGLEGAELDRLEQTFALHELGHIPAAYAVVLWHLAATRRLALVADVWSEKGPWLRELERAGVIDLFETLIFSSDIGSVKPSPRPFQIAVDHLGARPEDCVVVGDSARRDIGGAKAAGLAAIWIGRGSPPVEADGTLADLLDLAT